MGPRAPEPPIVVIDYSAEKLNWDVGAPTICRLFQVEVSSHAFAATSAEQSDSADCCSYRYGETYADLLKADARALCFSTTSDILLKHFKGKCKDRLLTPRSAAPAIVESTIAELSKYCVNISACQLVYALSPFFLGQWGRE